MIALVWLGVYLVLAAGGWVPWFDMLSWQTHLYRAELAQRDENYLAAARHVTAAVRKTRRSPAAQAECLLALAQVYAKETVRVDGGAPDTLPAAAEALWQAAAPGGISPRRALRIIRTQAHYRYAAAHVDAAFADAAAASRQAYGPYDPRYLQALQQAYTYHRYVKDAERTHQYARQIYQICTALYPPDDHRTYDAYQNLAASIPSRDPAMPGCYLALAQDYLGQFTRWSREGTATHMQRLEDAAGLFAYFGRPVDGAVYLQQALAIHEALGLPVECCWHYREVLGGTHDMWTKLPDAQREALIRRVLVLQTRLRGRHSRDIATILGWQARLRIKQGRYTEAHTLLRRACAIADADRGTHNFTDFLRRRYHRAWRDGGDSYHLLDTCIELLRRTGRVRAADEEALRFAIMEGGW